MQKPKFVKIIVRDNDKVLYHHYLRDKTWGYPAGQIADNKTPVEAAAEKLKWRTGFNVAEVDLIFVENNKDNDGNIFALFETTKNKLNYESLPQTEIAWSNDIGDQIAEKLF